MIQGNRIGLSAEQKAELWSRWKAGQSLHEIGRAFGKSHVIIHFLLARHGGIAGGLSIRQIARGLQRAASTVRGDVARHGGRPLYRANDADQQAWECLAAQDLPAGYPRVAPNRGLEMA